MRHLSGEIRPLGLRGQFTGELEGWLNVELHGRLHEVGPSDRHPDLAQVLLSVPPPEGPGADARVDTLTDYISRTMELGAGFEETEREDPGRAAEYQHLAEALVPWLISAPLRELKDVWGRGYAAGLRRTEQRQADEKK
ncbi:hypothetical protein OG413_20495 [Streptomyces sp. NBC_01433]|uniref:hypothetical protein n=1 Tax=Streptomyces sp. NBC_01433 TaxID=2903864 RepID=UPI00225076C5|nr:hypothetical protein [Streptomyces sp. NBC_01433]MCX4677654.1 hypothetical protein [Streptomyces sp. NBC_01433]